MSTLTRDYLARASSLAPNATEDVFKFLQRITHLHLSEKKLQQLEDIRDEFGPSLSLCRKLKVLYLQDNQLTHVDHLDFASHLTHLYLQNNLLEKIDHLNSLHALQVLYLSGNKIGRLEGLEDLNSLAELDVSNQKIEGPFTIDPTSVSAISYSLQRLSLSKCNCSSISDLSNLHRLSFLDLSNNNIDNVEDLCKVLSTFPSLRELVLTGNPVCKARHYRERCIMACKQLETLDGRDVLPQERVFLANVNLLRQDSSHSVQTHARKPSQPLAQSCEPLCKHNTAECHKKPPVPKVTEEASTHPFGAFKPTKPVQHHKSGSISQAPDLFVGHGRR